MNINNFRLIIFVFTLLYTSCFSQRKYVVKAWNGISIRKSPSFTSDKVGLLNYNYKFNVEEKSISKKDTIIENGFTITGNWVFIKTKKIKGYVFDGFSKRDYDINHNDYYYFFGKVKSFKDYSFYKNEPKKIDNKLTFNKNGQIKEVFDYYNDKCELDKSYTYNKDNKLITKKSGDNIYRYKYTKNIITELYIKNNKPVFRDIEKSDKKGNIILYESFNMAKNQIDLKIIYKYNKANKCIKQIHYLNGNKNGIIQKFKYKKDTILIREQLIAGNFKKNIAERKIRKSAEYKYDKYIEYDHDFSFKKNIKRIIQKKFNRNNELIKEDIYESASIAPNLEGSNQRTVKFYKNKKLFYELIYTNIKLKGEEFIDQEIQKEIYYEQNYSKIIFKNSPMYIVESYYDYQGRLLKSIEGYISTPKKQVTKYKYKFDNHGNWVKRQEFYNERLYTTKFQEFKYY